MKRLFIALLAMCLLPTLAGAMGYNYISQDDMRDRLNTNEKTLIVDICPASQFTKGHLPGSIETNAYPVKSDEERARLIPTLSQLKSAQEDIVIVCPGGRGGAKRTYDYYMDNGIAEKRLFILENGMNGWPYQTEAR